MILSQIAGITRYEFRMHWRRRGQKVVLLAILAVLIVPIIVGRGDMTSRAALGEEGVRVYTHNVIVIHWSTVAAVLFAVVPFLFADAIPRDRQLGVSDLLDSTPLPRYVYLLGKLCGAWLCIFSNLFLIGVISGSVWWFLVAPFDLSIYLPLWVVGALFMALINVGIIVPLTAGVSSGRIAVMLCIGFVVLLPSFFGLNGRADILDALNPLRPGIFYTYLQLPWARPPAHLSLEWTISLGLLQVVVVSIGMWVWLRLHDQR